MEEVSIGFDPRNSFVTAPASRACRCQTKDQYANIDAAPAPRKKEGRAARLAAMMERDGQAIAGVTDETPTQEPDDEVPPLAQPGPGPSTSEPKEMAAEEGSYSDAPDDNNNSS